MNRADRIKKTLESYKDERVLKDEQIKFLTDFIGRYENTASGKSGRGFDLSYEKRPKGKPAEIDREKVPGRIEDLKEAIK